MCKLDYLHNPSIFKEVKDCVIIVNLLIVVWNILKCDNTIENTHFIQWRWRLLVTTMNMYRI